LPAVALEPIVPDVAAILPWIMAFVAVKRPPEVTLNCGVTPCVPKAIPSVPTYVPAVVFVKLVLPLKIEVLPICHLFPAVALEPIVPDVAVILP
jgi:hypothetical protein